MPLHCLAAQASGSNYPRRPVPDLQPITMITSEPYILLTTNSLPVSSVKDLVALAKSKPGALSFASSGSGSILHLGAELPGRKTRNGLTS
jgi:tripartite-type tricarboxylate transporter receptor subunit TctC